MNEDILLDLSTDRKREKIAIDGKLYEMRAPQDFELREYQWMAQQGERIQELSGPGITAADIPKLTKMLNRVVAKIIRTKLPRRVLRRLTNAQKISIMNAFTSVALIKEETARPTPQHGKNSSRASNAFTADPSKAGSKPASAL